MHYGKLFQKNIVIKIISNRMVASSLLVNLIIIFDSGSLFTLVKRKRWNEKSRALRRREETERKHEELFPKVCKAKKKATHFHLMFWSHTLFAFYLIVLLRLYQEFFVVSTYFLYVFVGMPHCISYVCVCVFVFINTWSILNYLHLAFSSHHSSPRPSGIEFGPKIFLPPPQRI